jgi:GT2 family glycosyltransferase
VSARPEVTVVVPSHDRAARLRTLLDALAAQTLPRERWDVVVVHTYPPEVAAGLLDGHELSRAGALRHVAIPGADPRPSLQRNAGWRTAAGELIAFVDDDCRPVPEWLERLVSAARENPGAIVQGTTRPDPLEEDQFARAHVRTLIIEDPPTDRTETANILYRRDLLERIGGFDERAITGEDMDLGIRARATGAGLAGAPEALVYHAVEGLSTLEKIRSQFKWRHLAYVVKLHPELREWCEWGIWWKPEHKRATLALVALAGARRHPVLLAGVIPYVRFERWRHGPSKRQQLRALRELPAHWLVEVVEVTTFVRGSIRYRTLLL